MRRERYSCWFPGRHNKAPQTGGLKQQKCILPHPGDQTSEVKVSQGHAPSRGSRGGSLPPLPASGGSRRPWACGRVPPVSASVFTGLLLCVWVSRLLCLRRTLSLDVGPPSSRRISAQIFDFIPSAKTLGTVPPPSLLCLLSPLPIAIGSEGLCFISLPPAASRVPGHTQTSTVGLLRGARVG